MKKLNLSPLEQLAMYRDLVFDGNDFDLFIGKHMLTGVPASLQKQIKIKSRCCNAILNEGITPECVLGWGAWLPARTFSLESDSIPLDRQIENIKKAYENNKEFREAFVCVVFSGKRSYHVILKNNTEMKDLNFMIHSLSFLPDCDQYFLARKISRVAGCYRGEILQNLEYVK
jgi:hypothetical protein